MKTKLLLTIALSLLIGLGGCHSHQKHSDYCTVKGIVKGLKDGTKLELLDEFQDFKVIATTTVKDGAFEFHPDIAAPTHVYMYTKDEDQLKDFILEPGTILVEVDAADEEDLGTGAKGTPSNDIDRRWIALVNSGDQEAANALMDSVLDAEQTGVLALDIVSNRCKSSKKGLDALNRLSPELADLAFVAELRDELTRRMKTEAGGMYIDMEYPDVDGNLISLSSVVNNPANRYVLVDFWATWCDGCVAVLPELVELYAKYHDKGLEIYGMSADTKGRYELWKSSLTENNMTWVNVCDFSGGRKDSKTRQDYALAAYPTTVLIDGQTGVIIARGKTIDELDAMLVELLQE
ncbi:MAG: AhpC/TSA family protein [Bacteroidales bacterium]|nr:AhpC/TSA family protein [Bacteroidales bacterium]